MGRWRRKMEGRVRRMVEEWWEGEGKNEGSSGKKKEEIRGRVGQMSKEGRKEGVGKRNEGM